MNSSSLPLHITLPMAVLGLVHCTQKQWKFILKTKQGLLLKLLLGKEMDQGVYIECCYLSEHKFLSRRRSVSVQILQPWDGKGLISNILYFLELQKAYYHPKKARTMLWHEEAKRAASCDYNDYKCNMPRNKSLTHVLITVCKVWAQLHKNCAQTIVFWQQRGDLEGPNKNPELCITIHSSHNKHPVNSPSACKGVSALLFLWVD